MTMREYLSIGWISFRKKRIFVTFIICFVIEIHRVCEFENFIEFIKCPYGSLKIGKRCIVFNRFRLKTMHAVEVVQKIKNYFIWKNVNLKSILQNAGVCWHKIKFHIMREEESGKEAEENCVIIKKNREQQVPIKDADEW